MPTIIPDKSVLEYSQGFTPVYLQTAVAFDPYM